MTIVPVRSDHPPIVKVSELEVSLDDGTRILSDIDLSIAAGQVVALVGESGAGKTTLASAILGHARAGVRIAAGRVLVEGRDLLALSPEELRRARGAALAHAPQDPGTALNPMMRIGAHFEEILTVHAPATGNVERRQRIAAALTDVDLSPTTEFLRRFPHQLSGGQQQRVLLALAFLLDPRLVVLDEPTTALDPHTEARIVARVRDLCRRRGAGALYVSHNLTAVRALADRVLVLYAGRMVEEAPVAAFFARPLHPYSQGLVAAMPSLNERRIPFAIPGCAPDLRSRVAGCAFAPRCDRAGDDCSVAVPALAEVADHGLVACLRPGTGRTPVALVPHAERTGAPGAALLEVAGLTVRRGGRLILDNVSFTLRDGRCTALLGASGSGKTTLSRIIAGIDRADRGSASFDGIDLAVGNASRPAARQRAVQYVFQNATRALNPRHTVGAILGAAIRHVDQVDHRTATARAVALLGRVSLGEEVLARRPGDLSGGERQRVAIARGLIARPRLLICDEITSALDVSVQAAILATLDNLRCEGLSLLLVTHDMGMVRTIADDAIVMDNGRIVECGPAERVLDTPRSAAAIRLVASMEPARAVEFDHPCHPQAKIGFGRNWW